MSGSETPQVTLRCPRCASGDILIRTPARGYRSYTCLSCLHATLPFRPVAARVQRAPARRDPVEVVEPYWAR